VAHLALVDGKASALMFCKIEKITHVTLREMEISDREVGTFDEDREVAARAPVTDYVSTD
jgi:hypothetical protein